MEEDPLLVRWLKRGMYILRMLVGYSVPLMCVSLVENNVYSKATRSLFVMIVCYVQLLLGTVHCAVGSFLVFVYLPFLELETMSNLSLNYFTELIFSCFGQLVYSVAAQHSGLCHRLALWFLRRLRRGLDAGVFAMMAVAMTVSFWVDNGTAAAVMVVVVNDTFTIIERHTYTRMTNDTYFQELHSSTTPSGEDHIEISEELADELWKLERMRKTCLIGVGFSCTFGGMGFMSGHLINYYLKGIIEGEYGSIQIDALTWSFFHLPLCVVLTCASWGLLYFLFLGKSVESKYKSFIDNDMKLALSEQCNELGKMKLHEKFVLVNYVVLNIVLILGPNFIGQLSERSGFQVTSSAVWVAFVVLLFVLPANSLFDCHRKNRLLTWKVLNETMPWHLLFLASTCVVLSNLFRTSGLQQLVRDNFHEYDLPNPLYVQILISIVTAVVCEFCQNTVVVAIFAPYAAHMADVMQVHPLYFVLAVYHAGTLSIMWPGSCICNEVVFAEAQSKITDMAVPGLIIKVIGGIISILAINSMGFVVFSMVITPYRLPHEEDVTDLF